MLAGRRIMGGYSIGYSFLDEYKLPNYIQTFVDRHIR